MDTTLSTYLRTTDENERDHLLQELLLEQAAPVVRQVLRFRLRFYTERGRPNPASPDAEDLYHDILAKLMKVLSQWGRMEAAERDAGGAGRGDPEAGGAEAGKLEAAKFEAGKIKDFRQYATRVAVNACNDYLRAKYPARTRLKDKVRDTLERRAGFAIWRTGAGEMRCGLAAWRDREASGRGAGARLRALEDRPESLRQECFANLDPRGTPLPEILAGIFEWVREPMELETLVNGVAQLLEVRDQAHESIDDESSLLPQRLPTEDPSCEAVLLGRETLRGIWEALCRLPAHQQRVYVFGFADSKGDDLVSLLHAEKIVSPARVARQLGMPPGHLLALWKDLPMRNPEIAILMGVDRHLVNKWKFRAGEHVRKFLHQEGGKARESEQGAE